MQITHYICNITIVQEIYFVSPLKLHLNIAIQILQSVLFSFLWYRQHELFNDRDLLKFVISFFILINFTFDLRLIL